MDFRPMTAPERRNLTAALRGNVDQGLAIVMDRANTSFLGTAEDVAEDSKVINAIKSVPCHY